MFQTILIIALMNEAFMKDKHFVVDNNYSKKLFLLFLKKTFFFILFVLFI